MAIYTLNHSPVDPSRQRIGRTAHGYAAKALKAGGIYREKSANSPQAALPCKHGFGKCKACKRRRQVLFNGRCEMCRIYGFGGEDEDE